MRKRLLQLSLLCLSFFFLGCSSDESEPLVLTKITIASSNGNRLDIVNQEQITLTVSGLDQFNDPIEITSKVTWSVNNNNVSISASGLVSAVTIGTSVITAAVETIESTFNIRVWDSTAPTFEIYVSDVGNNRNGPHQIIKYDEFGEVSTTFIRTSVSKPQDIVFLEDQNAVLVSNLSTNDINKFDIETGGFIETFATGLSQPTRIDIGPDNLLYAIPWAGGPVKRYELDGTFVDDFTSGGINEAIGIAWDTNNNMYVASFNNGTNGFVRKFDTSGNDLGLFIDGTFSHVFGPTDIWFDKSGNLFANDWTANSVRKFDSEGNYINEFITNVSQPEGVAILDNGNILIGASGTGSVKLYSSSGSFIKDVVREGFGGLITPNAVVIRKVNL